MKLLCILNYCGFIRTYQLPCTVNKLFVIFTKFLSLFFPGWKFLPCHRTPWPSAVDLLSRWQPSRAFLANRNRMSSRFYRWIWCLLVDQNFGLRKSLTFRSDSRTRVHLSSIGKKFCLKKVGPVHIKLLAVLPDRVLPPA